MCICKTSIVIRTSGNLAAIVDFEHTSHETRSTTTRKFDPRKHTCSRWNFVTVALEFELCLGAISPPSHCRQMSQKPLPGERLNAKDAPAAILNLEVNEVLSVTFYDLIICLRTLYVIIS